MKTQNNPANPLAVQKQNICSLNEELSKKTQNARTSITLTQPTTLY